MASYIGVVLIDGNQALIGSTLYGICSTSSNVAAKTVVNADINNANKFINVHYDNPIQGTTIHVKFTQGNTVTTGMTLAVGSVTAKPVDGRCVCDSDTIISFTLDENEHWVVNDNVNTEYVFDGVYNATSNKALVESSVAAAAHKDVIESDISNNTSSTSVPTVSAVVSYVTDMTGGLAGLSGAMHFRGRVTDSTVIITDGGNQMPKIRGYDLDDNGVAKSNFTPEPGDVILFGQQEYVWTNNAWELLGDESSYALKSSTSVITEVTSFTSNTLPTLTTATVQATKINSVTEGTAASLTTTTYTIDMVATAGIATTASVSAGVLTINLGQNTTTTAVTIHSVDSFTANTPTTISSTSVSFDAVTNWNAGTTATLGTADTTVVVPNSES